VKPLVQLDTKKLAQRLDRVRLAMEVLKRRKSYVKAGVLASKDARASGEVGNVELAVIHNYGASTVPARPFILPPFLKNKKKYRAILTAAFKQSLAQGRPDDFDRALGLVGMSMQADIRNYVTQGANLATNAPSTIKAKGSSRPLVDTGNLLQSISYEVVS